MKDGYGWSQISQWEVPPIDAYIKYKNVDTGLSKAICEFMLVNRKDVGHGYLRCVYVSRYDVTAEIIAEAGGI